MSNKTNNNYNTDSIDTDQPANFNKTGILRTRPIQYDLDYYFKEKDSENNVQNTYISETLDVFYKYGKTVHIVVSEKSEVILAGTGKLDKVKINGVTKYLFSMDGDIMNEIDLEELFFENTENFITIKINLVKDAVQVVTGDGGKISDEENSKS